MDSVSKNGLAPIPAARFLRSFHPLLQRFSHPATEMASFEHSFHYLVMPLSNSVFYKLIWTFNHQSQWPMLRFSSRESSSY